jgi:hypothetical protein
MPLTQSLQAAQTLAIALDRRLFRLRDTRRGIDRRALGCLPGRRRTALHSLRNRRGGMGQDETLVNPHLTGVYGEFQMIDRLMDDLRDLLRGPFCVG